jgi:hypothetical protein
VLEYPKRFVKYQLTFLLEGFTIRLVDEDLHREPTILTLKLESVGVALRQRPAAANLGTKISHHSHPQARVSGVALRQRPAAANLVTKISHHSHPQARVSGGGAKAAPCRGQSRY